MNDVTPNDATPTDRTRIFLLLVLSGTCIGVALDVPLSTIIATLAGISTTTIVVWWITAQCAASARGRIRVDRVRDTAPPDDSEGASNATRRHAG